MHAVLTSALVASGNRGLDPDIVKPGWLALLIVVLLGVATYLLCRSFIKHSRRAAKPWEGDPPLDEADPSNDRRYRH